MNKPRRRSHKNAPRVNYFETTKTRKISNEGKASKQIQLSDISESKKSSRTNEPIAEEESEPSEVSEHVVDATANANNSKDSDLNMYIAEIQQGIKEGQRRGMSPFLPQSLMLLRKLQVNRVNLMILMILIILIQVI